MEYISPHEAARRWDISISTIRRMLVEKAFGDNAFKVRHRWRILATARPNPRKSAPSGGPKWLTTGGANSAWALHHAPQMTRFVRDLIERFQPRFIIVRHRKGERVFAVLKLIPTEYLPIVFELDFFLLMPSDHARDLLTNATVLILDDTCQKGRHANWMRSQLEGLEPTVKVITACLFLQRLSRTKGELAEPDIIAYQELDDYQYRLATAELSRVYRSLWPLDVEHPTIWFQIPEPISEDDIVLHLGTLGRIVELPPVTVDPGVRVIVVEDIPNPSYKSLGLPARVAEYWPPKLRCLWLRQSRTLVLAGIWFPKIQASIRWFRSYVPSQSEPWFSYLGLDHSISWDDLTPIQRAQRLFRALATYAGSRLVCAGYAAVVAGLTSENNENTLLEPVVEKEDYIRVYGDEAGQSMSLSISADLRREIEREIATNAYRTPELARVIPEKPIGDLTIEEFVSPIVDIFQHIPAMEPKFVHELSAKTMTRGDLLEVVKKNASTDDSTPKEGQHLIREFSSRLDVALDYAFISPCNLVQELGTSITVERAYEPCEVVNEPTIADIDATFVAKRLIYTVPLAISRFQTALGTRAAIHRLVFHKLFVNLQANLANGLINPVASSLERSLVYERGELLGPMANTVPVMTPHDVIEVDRFLQRRHIITVKQQSDGVYIDIDPSIQPDDCLRTFEDLSREMGESLLTDAELLGHIYKNIRHTEKYRGPTAGDMLTALAACSNEDRFIRYAVEDIRLWYQASTTIIALLSSPNLENADLEDDLDRMLLASSALANKLSWYSSIVEWRSEIEHLEFPKQNDRNDLQYAKLRLLRRIISAPTWDDKQRFSARYILDVQPMIRLVGILIRYVASKVNRAGRFAKAEKSPTVCSDFDPYSRDHDFCNLCEVCLALLCQSPAEIEPASAALAKLGEFRGREITPELMQEINIVWDAVKTILATVLQMSNSPWTVTG